MGRSPKDEGVVSKMKTKFEKFESEGRRVETDLVTGNDAVETTTTRKQPEAEKTKEIKNFWTNFYRLLDQLYRGSER